MVKFRTFNSFYHASADGTLRIWNLDQASVDGKMPEEILALANTPVNDLDEAGRGRQPRPLFELSESACADLELEAYFGRAGVSLLEVMPPPLFCRSQLTQPPPADVGQR